MTGLLQDRLLVSCPNADGGLLLLEGGEVERLSMVRTTGICAVPGGFLWARQSGDSNVLRRAVDGGVSSTMLAEDVLDLHDVAWHGGHAYVAATERNAVFELDADMRETRRWALRGERDSAHLNSICFHGGRLLASRFGQFDTHRGYKGATAGAGEVFDVETGEVLLAGLSQPHSLASLDRRHWQQLEAAAQPLALLLTSLEAFDSLLQQAPPTGLARLRGSRCVCSSWMAMRAAWPSAATGSTSA